MRAATRAIRSVNTVPIATLLHSFLVVGFILSQRAARGRVREKMIVKLKKPGDDAGLFYSKSKVSIQAEG
jgi:hypothetical protein